MSYILFKFLRISINEALIIIINRCGVNSFINLIINTFKANTNTNHQNLGRMYPTPDNAHTLVNTVVLSIEDVVELGNLEVNHKSKAKSAATAMGGNTKKDDRQERRGEARGRVSPREARKS